MSYLVNKSYFTFEYYSYSEEKSYVVTVEDINKVKVLSILYTLREAADDSYKELVTKLIDKNIKYWSMTDLVETKKYSEG